MIPWNSQTGWSFRVVLTWSEVLTIPLELILVSHWMGCSPRRSCDGEQGVLLQVKQSPKKAERPEPLSAELLKAGNSPSFPRGTIFNVHHSTCHMGEDMREEKEFFGPQGYPAWYPYRAAQVKDPFFSPFKGFFQDSLEVLPSLSFSLLQISLC